MRIMADASARRAHARSRAFAYRPRAAVANALDFDMLPALHSSQGRPMKATHRLAPGSRASGIARAALLALLATLFPVAAAAQKATHLTSIETRKDGDTYVLVATFLAPVPQPLCFEVLTDFDRFADFAPNVKTSRISKREGNRMLVEQTGVAKFGVAAIKYASQRQIDVKPPESILSVQVQGSMKSMQSLMQLSPAPGGTQMKYRIEMVPSAAASLVLTPERLERDIEEQFNALIAEMVRRKN
jgi:hypothetical protein